MKKGTYFILNKRGLGKDAKIEVELKKGYIMGEIGICKTGGGWTATHIPTGLRMAEAPTRQKALEQAEQIISMPTFGATVTAVMRSKYHKMFENAKQQNLSK